MKNPKKITFEGFYGFKNAGDDAFVEVASWGAKKYWNCNNNVFLGAHLPDVINKINTRQIFPTIKGFDRLNLFGHLLNSDYFISAGGSTFSKIPAHSNKALAKIYKRTNKRLQLGAIGVSIGPFENLTDEKNVIKYLESLQFLAVRDSKSFEYLSSLNLPYQPVKAFDLAALLPLVYESSSQSVNIDKTQKNIGISICNYESYVGGDLKQETKRNLFFKELLNLILENTNVHLKVFIINDNPKVGDMKVTQELLEGVDKKRFTILPCSGNVKKTWDQISSCDLMISTRLHASIFACYSKIPFILLEYHRKCSDFLDDVGQDEMFRVYDAEKSPQEVLQTVEQVLNNDYKKPTNVQDTIDRSMLNFTKTIV